MSPEIGTMARHILVLEDDATVRDFIVAALESEGHHVRPAASAEEGREIIEEASGQENLCLVVDVVLNDESGIAFAQEVLRRHPAFRVLLISGFTDEVLLMEPEDAARATFLAKPFTKDALLAAVDSLYN